MNQGVQLLAYMSMFKTAQVVAQQALQEQRRHPQRQQKEEAVQRRRRVVQSSTVCHHQLQFQRHHLTASLHSTVTVKTANVREASVFSTALCMTHHMYS